MKRGLLAGVVLCLVGGAADFQDAVSRDREEQEPPAFPPLRLPLVPADEAPASGTFYTFQHADRFPPMPMNQFSELPLYSLGDGFYLIDDRTVDYAALEEERSRRAVQDLAASLGVSETEAAGVMAASAAMVQVSGLTTNGLHLLPPAATNGGVRIEMGGGASGTLYDLFSTTNLVPSTNGGWQWRGRMANASPRILPDTAPEMFYILGTTQDTDGGGLTDAYERLVTHTQTNNPADDGTRPLVGIDLANTVVREQGNTTTQFNVWRVGSTAQPLAVALQRTGTATPGTDFTLSPIGNDAYPMDCVVTIPSGATNLLVALTALTDSVVESSETVTLTVPAGWPTFRPDPAHAVATAWILDIYSHTYTSNADFNLGQMSGLVTVSNQLQFQASLPAQFPYIAVACSDRGTVARVNTTNGIVVGEYRTSPKDAAFNDFPNPSRTTVDQYGNVWVANRDDNWTGEESMDSITRIGLILGGTRYRKNANGTYTVDPLGQYISLASATYNTCLDRDGDGYIRTSRGLADILPWSNQRGEQTEVDSGGGASTAEDEAILEYTRVTSTGTRTVAVDRWNDIWVGGWETKNHLKVDGLTGQPIGNSVFDPDRGGYGGVIDANGVLWSSGAQQDGTLRLVPPATFPVRTNDWSVCRTGNANVDQTLYGISADPVRDAIWQTAGSVVFRWNTNGTPYMVNGVLKQYPNGHNPALGVSCQGLVADLAGNVWVAHGPGHTNVGHLDTNGVYVGSVPLFTNALVGAYFANLNCEAPSVLTRLDGPVDFTNSFGAGVPTNNLSARWTGQVLPQASATYTFYVSLNAGAGVRLYVRDLWGTDQLLLDNWNNPSPSPVELSAGIDLSAGSRVNVRLEYKSAAGSPRVKLSWSWPGQAKTVIPRARLALGGLQPTGVAVAADGKIWATCYGTHNLMRIDPQGGPLVGTNRLGAVDMVVDLGDGKFHSGLYTNLAASPYNYSDMTGFNNRMVNPTGKPLEGWWRVVEDGQLARRRWTDVSWTATTPAGIAVLVAVRAADDRTALAGRPFVAATNGVALSGVRGRYLEIRAALRRNSTNAVPVLYDLTVRGESSGLGGSLTLPDVTAYEATDAVFVPDVVGAQPMTWEWTVYPAWAMQPVTTMGGPTLTFTNVDHFDDATQVSVLVTEATGDSVLLGPATLHVLPSPIGISSSGPASRYPATITVGGPPFNVSEVWVCLDGLSHANPDDLDILLVSPRSKKVMLMSDAGGTNAVTNATLFFYPGSGSPPPDAGPIPSNTQSDYTASNYEPGENLPAPAPAAPYSVDLSVLAGDNPIGEWKLYIHDDGAGASGTVARSWKLVFN